jgi:hypothetical protein
MSTDSLLVFALLYGVVPAWLIAGVADYLCHRRARIERTSGPRESLLHLLQFAEVGLPLLAVLFLQVNALVMLVMLAALVLHQITAILDVRYANATRRISPTEQHVHGVLEALPVAATFLVIVLHWPAFRALWNDGAAASFRIALKQPPLPSWYLVGVVVGVGLFGVLPYAEEFVRTLRERRNIRTVTARMD